MSRCACRCECAWGAASDCNDLCEGCWRSWCLGSEDHAPLADRSYVGVYGITGVWSGWLLSRGASALLAESATDLQRSEIGPLCGCGNRMVRRPAAWKCYRHKEPVVVVIEEWLPRSPALVVLPD